jgi:hypothetical protein
MRAPAPTPTAASPNWRWRATARCTNHAQQASRPFAPLLVVTDERGADLGETALPERVLGAGESVRITLQPALPTLAPGVYYVSVLPSHPGSGRAVGAGQHHVPMRLD